MLSGYSYKSSSLAITFIFEIICESIKYIICLTFIGAINIISFASGVFCSIFSFKLFIISSIFVLSILITSSWTFLSPMNYFILFADNS